MSEHTPGPWTLSTTGRYVRYEGVRGPNICDLDVFGGPPDEAAANAALIASAPDLQARIDEMRKTLLMIKARALTARICLGGLYGRDVVERDKLAAAKEDLLRIEAMVERFAADTKSSPEISKNLS